jgi:hypothetical protein
MEFCGSRVGCARTGDRGDRGLPLRLLAPAGGRTLSLDAQIGEEVVTKWSTVGSASAAEPEHCPTVRAAGPRSLAPNRNPLFRQLHRTP